MKISTFLFLLIITTYQVLGQATANSDGNWSNTGSWQGGNIGDGGEDVSMNANIDLVILSGETFVIGAINIGKSGSITVNTGGSLVINGLFTADKEFTINVAGTMTINGNMDVAKEITFNVTGAMNINGNVDLAKDAVLTVDGSLDVTGDFVSAQGASVTVNGDMSVDGDLNLGTGSVILGTGPVTAGTCSGSACGDSQLPVELSEFSVTINNHFVDISWITLTEEDNDFFTVERSADGINFEEIGYINGAGNSTKKISYSFTDKSPYKGISYYRLRQTDFDGDMEVFEIKAVHYTAIDRLELYPNPVIRGNELRVVTGAMDEEIIFVEIIDQAGHLISATSKDGAYSNITIGTDMNPGIYFLKISSGSIVKLKRIIIQ